MEDTGAGGCEHLRKNHCRRRRWERIEKIRKLRTLAGEAPYQTQPANTGWGVTVGEGTERGEALDEESAREDPRVANTCWRTTVSNTVIQTSHTIELRTLVG